MKLFVYDHCPYCIRAEMIFGLKNLDVEIIVMANHDEELPISMIGKKIAPILEKDDGTFMPESLDIVNFINDHFGKTIFADIANPKISEWLETVHVFLRTLLFPRMVQLPIKEFEEQASRDYFRKKKEAYVGNFDECFAQTAKFKPQLEEALLTLEPLIQSPSAVNNSLSMDDILLFPVLRNTTCIKDLKYPEKVRNYIDTMAQKSNVILYDNCSL